MRKVKRNVKSALNLPSLTLEGSLFLPDQLEKAALGQAKHQTETDYQTPKGLKLKDDYSRAFQIACAQWKHFALSLERKDVDALTTTKAFVEELLRDVFAYSTLQAAIPIKVNDRTYPITLVAGHLTVVVAPFTAKLDDSLPLFAIEGSGSRKKSVFQLTQELLNASDEHLWAIATNGKQLRLLRDAASLTRPSFLEIDLQDVLEAQRFSEFANIWRLLHSSRAALNETPENSIWEAWRETGKAEGARVRDGLRHGVEQALLSLGEGFIQHPANQHLRAQLDGGQLSKDAYFQQLLRLIYRLIFLFNVEERGVLHATDNSRTAQQARRAYAQGYALARLRDSCLKRRNLNHFDDQWQALRIVFKGLAEGEPRLALPALGGLFNQVQCSALDAASLSNKHLLIAIRHLRWANHDSSLAPVDYRNMGPEELGSVYESLLELVPEIDLQAKAFGFIGITSEGSTAGNARKTSGSYYTPDALVQELIRSALEPVIKQRLDESKTNPIKALLSIRVIDPACGSGHFLLAAARRLAQELAQLRAEDGAVKPQDYRHALREVISHCIFGVDRNPMALELARTALWLEGFEEGQPLSFLDHHLQCGDALLGLAELKALEYGVPKAAFKPLSGDEKPICTLLNKANTAALKQLAKDRKSPQFRLPLEQSNALSQLQAIEAMPQNSTKQIAKQESAYKAFLEKAKNSRLRHAADMVLGAFLLPKTEQTESQIPTTASVYLELVSEQHNKQHNAQRKAATQACSEAKVFHWPLAFPQVFAQGGFDCVLGNPPWEHIELKEEEFFATRNVNVVNAKNKAERTQRIQWLSEGVLAKHLLPDLHHPEHECQAEIRLFHEYSRAKSELDAASAFAHVKEDEGGRYPLTGKGRVNTYALFSESILQAMSDKGRAGFIVPTGIATDDSTKAFFGHISQSGRLVSLYDIENRDKVFTAVDSRMKFCLLTLGQARRAEFAFFLTQTTQLTDARRRFNLTPNEFRLINPNTLTCPVFRSKQDAELTKKLYCVAPVLIDEKNQENGNPWAISFMQGTHNMSSDSHMFQSEPGEGLLPLYEAKMIHQFDHRWATYDGDNSRDCTLEEKASQNFAVTPRYWVDQKEVEERLTKQDKTGNVLWQWDKAWLMGWRRNARSTDERTTIATVMPIYAHGDSLFLYLTGRQYDGKTNAALLANFNSLIVDFVARLKVGGMNFSYYYFKQLPVLPPDYYNTTDFNFIIPRVLHLTYTAIDLKPWAQDLGYDGEPFPFNPERRALLRAELDAYYAKLYDLTRDELRYILDPADLMGEDYPSETFRVLKNKEMAKFGEYRTQRLVLEAWDKLEAGELH
ncbi:Eco57I restriction-modification methylase domain-containing protein [Zooshikella ganghwensis]|uniref:site-specific DNA-methyltransferase (adenine-specific) n=1 Tax=Zooshikella ganghwensis TaxID=202772 RepID=A0A4P9VUA2_9GAMM|nr:N-6 DNA methylase [Zooshikella ganghwensis]RDH46489.1 SAM-dependent DNA methyltransferase [Zooshikella ganghwensis]